MAIDRRAFIASLGGAAAVNAMSHEARADALEDYMSTQLDEQVAANQQAAKYPTVAELEAQIESRNYRRGAGALFTAGGAGGNVTRLAPMPAAPTLLDFFRLRFNPYANHVLQSATRALKTGMSEEEYKNMMIRGGRSPEGNRVLGEDGNAQAHRQPQGSGKPGWDH